MSLSLASRTTAAALVALCAATVAHADTTSATQLKLLQEFNLIDLGNLSTSSEVEGRMFVNGNMSGQLSNVGFNGGLTGSPDGYATITVNGSVTGGMNVQTGNAMVGGSLANANFNNSSGTTSQVGGNISNVNVNGGTLQYSGSRSGNVNANGGATVQQVSGLTPGIAASTFNTLASLQNTLSGLTANSSVSVSQNTATFNAIANSAGQAIFNITAAMLQVGQFQFNMNGATSAIINVTGASTYNLNANFLGGQATSLAHELLWNFGSATSLSIGAEFGGTILADSASVSNSASIDGTLVAASFNQNGELHSYAYQGSLPDGGSTSVPEPASFALLAGGLFGLAALRRRVG